MKAEQRLDNAVNNPDFLSISGSRLYGTDTPTSDYDYRGFVVPPIEYLLYQKFESRDLEGDHKVYSLKRFFDLVLNGDPQLTELLFVSDKHVQKMTKIGEKAIEVARKYAVSNTIFYKIMGYSNSEWRKAMAIKIVYDKKPKEETEVLQGLWDCAYWLNGEQKQNIFNIIQESRPCKEVSSMPSIGQARKQEIHDYGYCVKSAAHSIRLVSQIIELMTTGNIVFPRPEADLLKEIRQGKVSKDKVNEIYQELKAKAEDLKDKSILMDKPNRNALWEKYTEIVVDYLKGDSQFNIFYNI